PSSMLHPRKSTRFTPSTSCFPNPAPTSAGFLHYPLAQGLPLSPSCLSPRRPVPRPTLRSDHSSAELLPGQVLPRPAAAHSLSRCRNGEELGLLNQPLPPAHPHHRPALQMPLAGGVVLQMGQATSPHQEVLRALAQCREDANLDRYLGVRAAGDPAQTPEARALPLHDFTNSKPHPFRENAAFTGFFATQQCIRVRSVSQPTQSIQHMTGQ